MKMKTLVLALVIAICAAGVYSLERFKRSTGSDLYQALKNRNEAEAIRLIEGGADINYADDIGHLPIHYAAKQGYSKVVQLLIDKDSSCQMSRTTNGETALHWAAWEGQVSVVLLLIKSGSDVNAKNNYDNTVLHWAAWSGKDSVVIALLAAGSATNVFNNEGDTPLHFTSRHNNDKVPELLVNFGAEIDAKNHKGETTLHWSAWNGQDKITQFLIRRGSNPNAKDRNGATPLLWAAWSGRDNMVSLLIAAGSSVSARDNAGDTPLIYNSEHDNAKIPELLLNNGADINERNNKGETLLHWAAWNGRDKIAKLLIKRGADTNVRDKLGATPLHWAAWVGREDMVKWLLDAVATINAENNDKDTPLHLATREGHYDAAKLLIDSGADIQMKNKRGQSPRDLAVENGYHNIISYLDAPSNNGTPNRGSETNNQDVIKLIERVCARYSVAKPVDFILEGVAAKPEEFPWMAALGYLNQRSGGVDYRCGGTIISEKFVMTAAHCVNAEQQPVVVRLGTIYLQDPREAKTYYIKNIIKHESYSVSTKKNDIALIQLSKDIIFTASIRAACLETNKHDEAPNIDLTVTGWGSTRPDSTTLSDKLLKAEVKTMPLSQCNTTYLNYNLIAQTNAFRDGISESQYCAFDPESRKDSCRGDSGGPLQIFRNNYTAHVIGIVSFGVSCGSQLPGIYTRVASYSDWIATHVWPNGQ